MLKKVTSSPRYIEDLGPIYMKLINTIRVKNWDLFTTTQKSIFQKHDIDNGIDDDDDDDIPVAVNDNQKNPSKRDDDDAKPTIDNFFRKKKPTTTNQSSSSSSSSITATVDRDVTEAIRTVAVEENLSEQHQKLLAHITDSMDTLIKSNANQLDNLHRVQNETLKSFANILELKKFNPLMEHFQRLDAKIRKLEQRLNNNDNNTNTNLASSSSEFAKEMEHLFQ